MGKSLFRFVGVMLFVAGLLSAGCQTKKASASGWVSEAGHQAALQALESGNFYIEIYEFYFHKPHYRGKGSASTHGSFFTVKDGKGELYVNPATFRHDSGEHAKTEYAVLSSGKKEKENGDVVFSLSMRRPQRTRTIEQEIILYAASNECYVYMAEDGTEGFRGRVYAVERSDVN